MNIKDIILLSCIALTSTTTFSQNSNPLNMVQQQADKQFQSNSGHNPDRQKEIDKTMSTVQSRSCVGPSLAKTNPILFCYTTKSVPTADPKHFHWYRGQNGCSNFCPCMDWMDLCSKDNANAAFAPGKLPSNFMGGGSGFGDIPDAEKNPSNKYNTQALQMMQKSGVSPDKLAQQMSNGNMPKEIANKIKSDYMDMSKVASDTCNMQLNEDGVVTNNPVIIKFCPVTQRERDTYNRLRQEFINNTIAASAAACNNAASTTGTNGSCTGTPPTPEQLKRFSIPRQYISTANQMLDRVFTMCTTNPTTQLDQRVNNMLCIEQEHNWGSASDPYNLYGGKSIQNFNSTNGTYMK